MWGISFQLFQYLQEKSLLFPSLGSSLMLNLNYLLLLFLQMKFWGTSDEVKSAHGPLAGRFCGAMGTKTSETDVANRVCWCDSE